MNTTVITIKIDKKTKDQAQNLAEELGFSLSAVIKAQLKSFIRSKTVDVSLSEKPTQYMIDSLKQSEADVKAGRVVSFKSGKEAIAYLRDELRHEK